MGIYDRDYYQADEMRPLRPWDNKSMVTLLIITNVVVHLLNFLLPGNTNAVSNFLSLSPSDLTQPWLWFRLLTYGFVHDPRTIFHLLFNMLTLYFLGRQVEDKYGRGEFLRIYLVMLVLCGLGWCLLHFTDRQQNPHLLGASGAVTGISMLFVFSFPQATLLLYGILPVKAWLLGIGIVIVNIFSSSDSVAYDVHLMGVAFAAIYFFGNLSLDFVGGWFSRAQTTIRQKRRGLKVHRADEIDAVDPVPNKDEVEADRLLDKIHRQGKDSLTTREQKFLEAYSRKVREQRK